MKFPSWEEFKEKTSKFESFLDDKRKEFRDNIQGFKDKHQTADEIITTAVRLLPSPFNAIAEAIYKGQRVQTNKNLSMLRNILKRSKDLERNIMGNC